LQQYGVEQIEDGGVGPDSQGQGQHGCDRKSRRAAALPPRVASITAEFVEKPQTKRFPTLVLPRFDGAEFSVCSTGGIPERMRFAA
jgi:hypothetical protein